MSAVLEGKEQFIINASGQRVSVVLDLDTYERLCEAAEDNFDLRAYRAANIRVKQEMAQGKFTTPENYRARRLRKQK
jgi:hypothetical protein